MPSCRTAAAGVLWTLGVALITAVGARSTAAQQAVPARPSAAEARTAVNAFRRAFHADPDDVEARRAAIALLDGVDTKDAVRELAAAHREVDARIEDLDARRLAIQGELGLSLDGRADEGRLGTARAGRAERAEPASKAPCCASSSTGCGPCAARWPSASAARARPRPSHG